MKNEKSVSRRRFLGVAGSAGVWTTGSGAAFGSEPRSVTIETAREVGMSKWDLDTPALVVELDALEANLRTMQQTAGRNGIASRPHAKTHKCPAIARLQLAAGAVGICVAKVSEAEVMFEHGIDRILMTTTNVTPLKIRRAMALKKWCPEFIQATDSAANAEALAEAARAEGVIADVVVDVDPGGHRTGVTAGEPALDLARLVDRLEGLKLRGILCYDGGSQHVKGFAKRKAQTLERLAPAVETLASMKRSGLNTEIFSGGGTGSYNIDHANEGFTDVQVGSYVFMDAQYLAIGGENDEVYSDFEPSLTILTTVLNDQYEGRATADAGAKACTINQPWPIVKGESGIIYRSGSDEFGSIRYEDPSHTYRVGDKLELIVSHCDPVVNLYDRMYAVRKDRIEAVWPVAARGMST